jgi:succinate-semialdehyde dehydrogenase/glutarate-semialdehyde dehydrogenase
MHLSDQALLKTQLWIEGRWCAGEGGDLHPVIDPATGREVARVARASRPQVDQAIAAAQRAQPAWAKRTGKSRARLLRDVADAMIEHQEDLAQLITAESGKPISEARGEVAYAAGFLEWFGEEAKRVYGSTIPAPVADQRITVMPQPIGVCAAITPWNFPAAMIARKLGAALATGNTLVIKPAEATPLTALAMAEIAARVGIDPGVINVVTGDAAVIGDAITQSPIVRKLSFTGSTQVGKQLAAQCAPTLKRVSLELGGNAPFIVFDDADVDAAVEGAIASKFRNAGQTCVCANRILVQRAVHDAFVARMAERIAALVVGAGEREQTTLGPLINQAGLRKVDAHVTDALAHGAHAVVGAHPHALGGNFYAPTLLTGVTPAMRISNEETFGPVAGVQVFTSEADALALANATPFGLAAYFYARDVGRIVRVSEGLEFGIVGVNTGLVSTEVAPFGGIKHSGYGREGSRYGLEDWVALKYLCVDVR